MTELPDYNKIMFPQMPPIPLEKIVPDASPEVRTQSIYLVRLSPYAVISLTKDLLHFGE